MSVSFRIAAAYVMSSTTNTNAWRITTNTKSERNSPDHVAREIFATERWLVMRENGAPMSSVSMDSIKMQQGVTLDSRNQGASRRRRIPVRQLPVALLHGHQRTDRNFRDRKSTRLNSSHVAISYAVFCLKKK